MSKIKFWLPFIIGAITMIASLFIFKATSAEAYMSSILGWISGNLIVNDDK